MSSSNNTSLYVSRHTVYRNHSDSSSQNSSESWASAYPSAAVPAPQPQQQSFLPMNQYSTLANYDGSYSGRRISQPPPTTSGTHMPNSSMSSGSGVPVVPSNVPGSHYRSNSTVGASPSSKTFLCEICGQSFTRAHDRKRHYQIHTRNPDEGPRCQWCKKKFSRDDALKRHLDHGCDDMPDEVYAQRRTAH